MITHNKSLEDKLIEVSNIISAKAREYDDAELSHLKDDFDWMVQHDIQAGSYDKGYEQGHEDGYEEARDEIRSMI